MAAPDYVPVPLADMPRESLSLPPSRRWTASRPADLLGRQPEGAAFGNQGPDQGYALGLAERFEDELVLEPGEDAHDVMAGAVAVAMKRASLFGRAPVIHDVELGLGLFGFLDSSAPPELCAWRHQVFAGAGHDYWDQRAIADRVPESSLRMTPAQARAGLTNWKSMIVV